MVQTEDATNLPSVTTSASTLITNADRIRAMSDEELAKWLSQEYRSDDWLEWLKEEVEE